jgi:ankyrin repeat protein
MHDGHGHVACGWTPLLYASWEGHGGVARLLLDAGADPNRQVRAVTPLWLAAEGGHVGLMRLLLGRGARTRFPHPRFTAGSLGVITAAARSGSVVAVRLLLDAGEFPNSADVTQDGQSGYTPLQAAVNFGHVEVVRLLLARGADVNRRDAQGGGPLRSAIYYANGTAGGHPQRAARLGVLALLLAARPPLDLHEAAAIGDTGTLRRLLDAGADINAEDRYGRTAFMPLSRRRPYGEAGGDAPDRGARLGGTSLYECSAATRTK